MPLVQTLKHLECDSSAARAARFFADLRPQKRAQPPPGRLTQVHDLALRANSQRRLRRADEDGLAASSAGEVAGVVGRLKVAKHGRDDKVTG
jgi:hypothetical protein